MSDGFRRGREDDNATATDAYLTASLALSPTLDLTARFGYADVNTETKDTIPPGFEDQTGMEGITPGVGVIWQPLDRLRLRAAAGRTVRRPFVANQTLQPTQLAGFNEQFDDFDGTRADWLGLAVDVRASDTVRVGAETMLRWLTRELVEGGDHRHGGQRDDRATAYLYWTPTDRIAASLELIAEHYSANERDNPPDGVLVAHSDRASPAHLLHARPDGSPPRKRRSWRRMSIVAPTLARRETWTATPCSSTSRQATACRNAAGSSPLRSPTCSIGTWPSGTIAFAPPGDR